VEQFVWSWDSRLPIHISISLSTPLYKLPKLTWHQGCWLLSPEHTGSTVTANRCQNIHYRIDPWELCNTKRWRTPWTTVELRSVTEVIVSIKARWQPFPRIFSFLNSTVSPVQRHGVWFPETFSELRTECPSCHHQLFRDLEPQSRVQVLYFNYWAMAIGKAPIYMEVRIHTTGCRRCVR